MPSRSIEILTSDLEALPVVQAWRALDLGPATPVRVEVLRRKQKSVVYRLVGVGTDKSDIIAKSGLRDTAVVERQIYKHVLPHLPVSQLRYYASVDAPGTDFCWLFLEDASGEEFAPKDPGHRALATRWLAGLHTGAADVAPSCDLPDRGPGYYRGEMHAARQTIRDNFGNPALSSDDRDILVQVLRLFDVVESRWEAVDELSRSVPRSLVHNDFAERNVRVRRNGTGLEVVAFDWEVAGWGLPTVDLAHADVDLYAALVREAWPGLDFTTLCRAVTLGRLLRGGLAASNWCVGSLATSWVETSMIDLRVYRGRIDTNLQALGWKP